MESIEVKKRGRGRPRKRKLNDEESEELKSIANALKKQALDFRWKLLVGRYVLKEYDSVICLRKIVYYNTGFAGPNNIESDCRDRPNNTWHKKQKRQRPNGATMSSTMQTLYIYSVVHSVMFLYTQYLHRILPRVLKYSIINGFVNTQKS